MKSIQTALRGFRSATLYAVGVPEQPAPPRLPADTDSTIMGCPIIATTEVRRETWFDSLNTILSDPKSYDQRDRLCDALGPDYILRLRLAADTVTVLTSLGCAQLGTRIGSGGWVTGWLDKPKSVELKNLLDSAIAEAMAHANTRPTVISAPEPTYPEEVRNMTLTGRVVLRVLVGADGKVKDATARGPYLLQDLALRAVRAWTFNPARQRGVSVATWIELPVNFRMP